MAEFDPKQCKVALLAGGTSGEREISLKSGEGAKGALIEAGFEVTQLDPANKDDLKALVDGSFDVAFLCTHGRKGEDGVLQGFLELIGLPYTGPGVLASALAMNKAKAKLVYDAAGVPTADYVVLRKGEDFDVAAIVEKIGEHVVIKAANEGSTIGIYIVSKADEIAGAVEQAFEYDAEVVVERFIPGSEYTVAVVGNSDPVAFPIIQIIPKNDFYDFESKYAPGGSQHLCPAPLSDEVTAEMQRLAVLAYRALGCTGVSRTDFIVDENDNCWALETNTLPGMTATSLLPDAARAAGISFPELCVQLVQFALEER